MPSDQVIWYDMVRGVPFPTEADYEEGLCLSQNNCTCLPFEMVYCGAFFVLN